MSGLFLDATDRNSNPNSLNESAHLTKKYKEKHSKIQAFKHHY